MTYYAIRNKRTGKYISGTDYSCKDGKPRQIMHSALRPPRLFNGVELRAEMLVRRINLKYYEVVAVEVRQKEPIQ